MNVVDIGLSSETLVMLLNVVDIALCAYGSCAIGRCYAGHTSSCILPISCVKVELDSSRHVDRSHVQVTASVLVLLRSGSSYNRFAASRGVSVSSLGAK